jgi:hypothetical protein
MDVFELFFKCYENGGKGDHCVYCRHGPKPGCEKRLYSEFRRNVRQLLCPLEIGQRVYVLRYLSNPYRTTTLEKGYVSSVKNDGRGWKFGVKSEDGETFGGYSAKSLGTTVFTTRSAAEEAKKKGK